MIYEYFRATGAHEAVQGLSDLFSVSLQNDDIQDFDVRWDHALLSVSEMPFDMILDGLYKSNVTLRDLIAKVECGYGLRANISQTPSPRPTGTEFCSTSDCLGLV